jgi:putative tryptophan/tyrosine transport system substrate-binding protein
MKRRKFITLLASAAIVAKPTRVFPQTTSKMPTVAVLLTGNADDTEAVTMVSAFEQGMRLAGWTKDVNVHLDYRWGGTDPQQAASAAAEVAALKPDEVVAIGSPVVVAMQRVTATIPIVFAVVSDPVGQGLVTTLAHPHLFPQRCNCHTRCQISATGNLCVSSFRHRRWVRLLRGRRLRSSARIVVVC